MVFATRTYRTFTVLSLLLLTRHTLQNELQKQKRRVEKSQTQVMRDYEAYISGNLTKEAFLQRKAAAKEVEAEAGIQVVLLTKQLEQLSA